MAGPTSATRNADVEQARLFVVALNEHVDACSAQIQRLQARALKLQQTGSRSAARIAVNETITLRAELYNIHRQLDRLHDAFPELRASRPLHSRPAYARHLDSMRSEADRSSMTSAPTVQITAVRNRLAAKFPDVDGAVVDQSVAAALERSSAATVRDFLPLLVKRKAAEGLAGALSAHISMKTSGTSGTPDLRCPVGSQALGPACCAPTPAIGGGESPHGR